MSEITSPQRRPSKEALAHQILALQQTILPELKKRAKDQLTYGGLGSHVMKDIAGRGEVKITGNLWTEEELEQNATIWINLTADHCYRIDVRKEILCDAYDQNGRRVEDEVILDKLRKKLLRKRLAYRAIHLIDHIRK